MILKTFKYSPPPHHGDRRTMKKFAWLPTFVYDSPYADTHLVWLEHLEKHQIYKEGYNRNGDSGYWGNKWITIAVKIIND